MLASHRRWRSNEKQPQILLLRVRMTVLEGFEAIGLARSRKFLRRSSRGTAAPHFRYGLLFNSFHRRPRQLPSRQTAHEPHDCEPALQGQPTTDQQGREHDHRTSPKNFLHSTSIGICLRKHAESRTVNLSNLPAIVGAEPSQSRQRLSYRATSTRNIHRV